eukprot:351628-Chlamydomonas_euryale.AAC.1
MSVMPPAYVPSSALTTSPDSRLRPTAAWEVRTPQPGASAEHHVCHAAGVRPVQRVDHVLGQQAASDGGLVDRLSHGAHEVARHVDEHVG